MHAEAISLWRTSEDATPESQEEQRRTWLSVRIVDQWSADDSALEPQILAAARLTASSTDESGLDMVTSENSTECSGPELSEYDMWLQMGAMLPIFARISGLLRRLSLGHINFTSFCQEAPNLTACLDKWIQNMPEGSTFSLSHLDKFSRLGSGRTFLAMHMAYHHFRQMLHFPFLDARNSHQHASLTSTIWDDGVLQCKLSANEITLMAKASSDVENCELNYFIYAHIVVVSSCVHLHALLFDDNETELKLARERLMSNFQFLMALKSYWPVADVSVCCSSPALPLSTCFLCVM